MQKPSYRKRQERAMVRELQLRALGHETYGAYLRSPAWRDLKARYRESDLPQICMCGETKVELHHTTYERVGRELLEDLVPLCHDCHVQAHVLEAEGVIELDLKGFYYDEERARDGKMYLAQLDAACPPGEVLRADKLADFHARRAEYKAARRPAPWRRDTQELRAAVRAAKAEAMAARPEDLDERSFAA